MFIIEILTHLNIFMLFYNKDNLSVKSPQITDLGLLWEFSCFFLWRIALIQGLTWLTLS